MNAVSTHTGLPAGERTAAGGDRRKAVGRRLAVVVLIPLGSGAVGLLVASLLGVRGRWASAIFYAAPSSWWRSSWPGGCTVSKPAGSQRRMKSPAGDRGPPRPP